MSSDVRRLSKFWPRLPYRRRFDLTVGGVVALIVVALGVGVLMQRHPSERSILEHVDQSVAMGQAPHLSDAEVKVLADAAREQNREQGWTNEDVTAASMVVDLPAPGERRLRVGYDDGWIGLSDVRHWGSQDDVQAAIEALDTRRTVIAGGPGEAIVGGCCEGSDARVTVALRRGAPPLGSATTWPESSEVDLDLGSGALVFSSTGGTSAVVNLPEGRYRLRVSGAGAWEGQQEKDAYLVELWPRTANAPLRVLRPTRSA
jgi:hypothetical protein